MIEIKDNISPREYFPNSKYIIEYGFSIADKHYFRFDDPLNNGNDRALKTLVYFKEMDMNTDRPFLLAHTQAFDNVYSQPSMSLKDLTVLATLNDQLKQRLEMPKEPDLMYKLAAVIFFDQNENPDIYEFAYGEKKIKLWKKETSLEDFFLHKHLMELMPYLEAAGANFLLFSRAIEQTTRAHLDYLLPLLSDEQKTALLNSRNLLRSSPENQ